MSAIQLTLTDLPFADLGETKLRDTLTSMLEAASTVGEIQVRSGTERVNIYASADHTGNFTLDISVSTTQTAEGETT